jgi:hypothetical protein
MKKILVWTLSATSLQYHMAKVHIMELGKQKDSKKGKSANPYKE